MFVSVYGLMRCFVAWWLGDGATRWGIDAIFWKSTPQVHSGFRCGMARILAGRGVRCGCREVGLDGFGERLGV
mgnify:CR=1 FL=1